MALSYAETCNRLYDIISDLSFPLFMGETKEDETVKALRKQVSSLYHKLNRENKLDLLHAYNAESKADLIDQAVAQLFDQLDEMG